MREWWKEGLKSTSGERQCERRRRAEGKAKTYSLVSLLTFSSLLFRPVRRWEFWALNSAVSLRWSLWAVASGPRERTAQSKYGTQRYIEEDYDDDSREEEMRLSVSFRLKRYSRSSKWFIRHLSPLCFWYLVVLYGVPDRMAQWTSGSNWAMSMSIDLVGRRLTLCCSLFLLLFGCFIVIFGIMGRRKSKGKHSISLYFFSRPQWAARRARSDRY